MQKTCKEESDYCLLTGKEIQRSWYINNSQAAYCTAEICFLFEKYESLWKEFSPYITTIEESQSFRDLLNWFTLPS